MKRLLASLFAAVATLGCSAHTHQLLDLEVIDRDTGARAEVFHRSGQAYVAGEPGHRYSVRLRNKTGERVLAVLSIDGVNAVSGETAAGNQAGYVLSPYESAEINGWRKSLDDVAQFVFSSPEASYAARTGRPQNVGVIGVAVFREAMPIYRPQPYPRRFDEDHGRYGANEQRSRQDSANAPAPATGARDGLASQQAPAHSKRAQEAEALAGAAPDVGTAHGQREWAPVGTTEFRRRSYRPDEVVSLQYRSPEFLVDNGIAPPCSFGDDYGCRPRGRHQPEAFPMGFVPDPY